MVSCQNTFFIRWWFLDIERAKNKMKTNFINKKKEKKKEMLTCFESLDAY